MGIWTDGDRAELAARERDGELWSEMVPGVLRPTLPALVKPGHWVALRRRVRLAGARWRGMARALETCGQSVKVFQCKPCGARAGVQVLPVLCMSRYCRHCAKAKRKRSQARVREVLRGWTDTGRIRLVTLTVRSASTFARSRAQLTTSFRKLRRRKWWKKNVIGGLAAIETTINRAGFHPHVHALVDGNFLPQARLVDEWMSVNGCRCYRSRDPYRQAVLCCHDSWEDRRGAYNCCTGCKPGGEPCPCEGSAAGPAGQDVRLKSEEDAIREAAKYAAKELGQANATGADGKQREPTPAEMAEFLRSTVGRRLLTTFGYHFDLQLAEYEKEDAETDLGDSDTGPLPKCDRCGEVDYRFVGMEPTQCNYGKSSRPVPSPSLKPSACSP